MVIKFPGWRYHPTAGKRLVQSEAEEAELGPGWSDSLSPVRVPVEPEADVPATPTKASKKHGST